MQTCQPTDLHSTRVACNHTSTGCKQTAIITIGYRVLDTCWWVVTQIFPDGQIVAVRALLKHVVGFLSFDGLHFPVHTANGTRVQLYDPWVGPQSASRSRPSAHVDGTTNCSILQLAFTHHSILILFPGQYCVVSGFARLPSNNTAWAPTIARLPESCRPIDGKIVFTLNSDIHSQRVDVCACRELLEVTAAEHLPE